MGHADYRKHNDGSHNSSTYHKKDGTPVRSILKREAKQEVKEATEKGLAMGEATPKWFCSFYADAYEADHLKPDEWETNCPESELDEFILTKIAERLGVDKERVTFQTPNSETVCVDGIRVGSILCW